MGEETGQFNHHGNRSSSICRLVLEAEVMLAGWLMLTVGLSGVEVT